MKIVATMVVRDEGDIIADNIDYHLSQGVSQFIVMDNGSIDETSEVLARYGPVVHVINQPDKDYRQAAWVTQMARMAFADYGADWVINLDADEFWVANKGTRLTTELGNLHQGFSAVSLQRFNMLGEQGDDPWWKRMSWKDLKSSGAKRAARGRADVVVSAGSHAVSAPGGLVAGVVGVTIYHFPCRSYPQWRQSVVDHRDVVMNSQTGLNPRWEQEVSAYDHGFLDAFWKDEVEYDAARIRAGWIAGQFVRDDAVLYRMQRVEALRSTGSRMAIAPTPALTPALATDGILGPRTIGALQGAVGAQLTYILDEQTVTAVQQRIGVTPDGGIGTQTARALSAYVGAGLADDVNIGVVRRMQETLNRGEF